jgi:hypothetical protein
MATAVNGKTAATARKMPIKTRRITLTEEGYEGWWVDYRTNPPLGRWGRGVSKAMSFSEDDPASSMNTIEGMLDVLELTLVEWNFVDEEGNDLPKTREGLDRLPQELLNAIFAQVNEGVSEAPLETNKS